MNKPAIPATEPPPPVMQWREFADWIRVDQMVVKGWINKGYIPVKKFGKHTLVNVALLSQQLLEEENLL